MGVSASLPPLEVEQNVGDIRVSAACLAGPPVGGVLAGGDASRFRVEARSAAV